jgi:hypothetical protein
MSRLCNAVDRIDRIARNADHETRVSDVNVMRREDECAWREPVPSLHNNILTGHFLKPA